MLVMGVDENGLGPRLGPLVATAVTLRTPAYARSALCRRGLAVGLTDSKQTGGFGRMAFIESVALALVAGPDAEPPASADALLGRVAPPSERALRACCPDPRSASQCWGVDLALPAYGGEVSHGRALLRQLVGRSRLEIVDVQSRIACAGVLNQRLASGVNKLSVDLGLFEELIESVHADRGGPLLAVCGMVGGIRDYAPRFRRFGARRVEPLGRPRRGVRRYAVEDVGELRFEVDADARHLPVALASMVGKYVREVCMQRIGEFYRRLDTEVSLASGYYDPVTTRFIEATAPSRRRLGIATDCFRRRA